MNRRCTSPEGCTRQASFGPEGARAASFCMAHKAPSHVNVRTPRCVAANCTRQRTFGPIGAQPLFCASHRNATHVNLVSRVCRHPHGCRKIPSFGEPGDAAVLFCAEHCDSHHINLRKLRTRQPAETLRRCEHLGCKVGARVGQDAAR